MVVIFLSVIPQVAPQVIETNQPMDSIEILVDSSTGYKENEIALLNTGINNPPTKPSIDGPSQGKPDTEYEFRFCSTDPDGDSIYYCIDWGDGNEEVCVRPFPSGACVVQMHSWSSEKTYIIKVKARDTKGAESETATHAITMPKNKQLDLLIYLLPEYMQKFELFKRYGCETFFLLLKNIR